MEPIVEICCGSYYDALQAYNGGADRIELNSALMLGGMTPSVATLRILKEQLPKLKVIAMVRPRGGGFCYHGEDFKVMLAECEDLLKAGTDGIAFGCLTNTATVDMEKNKQLISLIKKYGKEAVFHRAFDCVPDPFTAMEELISIGADRVLTSGQKQRAAEGECLLKELQKRYGNCIEILAGSGINAENAPELIKRTGIYQIHSSCKDWVLDPTTVRNGVSYGMAKGEKESMYDVVSEKLVRELVLACKNITE